MISLRTAKTMLWQEKTLKMFSISGEGFSPVSPLLCTPWLIVKTVMSLAYRYSKLARLYLATAAALQKLTNNFLLHFSMFTCLLLRSRMSDVQSKSGDVKSLEVVPKRQNFVKVASEACYAYLPVAGSVSGLVFTTCITNPRILQRWAILGYFDISFLKGHAKERRHRGHRT